MSSPGGCGRDPAATLSSPGAVGDVAGRQVCGAAWRNAWRAAKVV
jgi:hypothetical protein